MVAIVLQQCCKSLISLKTIILKDYVNKWSIKRLIQLGVGLFFVYYYTKDHSTFALIFGIVMLTQALLNVGCFSTKGCTNSIDEKEIHDFAKEIKKIKD